MRVAIGYRAVILVGVTCVGAILECGSIGAQAMANRLRVPSGSGSTVSVATLRIPEKAWKHFAKAKVAAERNRLDESDRETEKALAIAPDFAAAYLLRAGSEVKAHSFEQAIANVKEARRVEPDLMWAGVILAGAYNGLHRYEEARQVLAGLHGVEAQSWQAAYENARAATGLGDIDGGLHWSEIAFESAPRGFSDARLLRSNALILAQRWSEAQAQMEIYLESKATEERRSQVLHQIEMMKRRIREDELQKVASR